MTTTYSSTNSNTKSLNAHMAEKEGRYPASHWPAILRRKGLFPGVTAADIKAAVWTDEWHHTGTFAAHTNYYSLQDIYDYRRELRQEILRRKLQKAWFPVVMHEAARVSFTEGQERVRGAKDRERIALMVKAPIRWPTTEQAGIADLPLFGAPRVDAAGLCRPIFPVDKVTRTRYFMHVQTNEDPR